MQTGDGGVKMEEDYYRLVSTSRKRALVSPFCFRGKRIAAFYHEEAAMKIARALRESEWKTVYGCYAQPDGSFLIGLASARAGGKFRQKIALQRIPGPPDASAEVWKTVTADRITGPLDVFARSCLNTRMVYPRPTAVPCINIARNRRMDSRGRRLIYFHAL